MGTPRLELAFDQAVSSDFFSVASPEFLRTALTWIDQALAPIVAIASDFILCRRWFCAKLPWIKASIRVDVLSSKMRLRMGRIKGFF